MPCCADSASNPGPLSCTSKRSHLPVTCSRTEIRESGPLCLVAFCTRGPASDHEKVVLGRADYC